MGDSGHDDHAGQNGMHPVRTVFEDQFPGGILPVQQHGGSTVQFCHSEQTVAPVSYTHLLVIDLDNHEVTQSGRHLDLTLKEYELLRILLSNSSRVVPRDELLGEIWGFDFVGETRTLDMHIKTLRAKLHDDVENPRYIKTIRSVGYKFIG